MKVWVVTVDDFSQEGLEGAFDVFESVHGDPLSALASINPPDATYRYPTTFELEMVDSKTARITKLQEYERRDGSTYESHQQTWTLREIEL